MQKARRKQAQKEEDEVEEEAATIQHVMQKCRGAEKLATLFHAVKTCEKCENFPGFAYFFRFSLSFQVRPINFWSPVG